MENENVASGVHYKVVRRTINGCPVSVWADAQSVPTPNLPVLWHLLVAFEDRLKLEQAEQ